MWAMRRPVSPGWAEEQTPTPFLCTKESMVIINPDWGVIGDGDVIYEISTNIFIFIVVDVNVRFGTDIGRTNKEAYEE